MEMSCLFEHFFPQWNYKCTLKWLTVKMKLVVEVIHPDNVSFCLGDPPVLPS